MTTLTGNRAAPSRSLAEAEDVRPTRRRLGPGEPIRFGGLLGIAVLLVCLWLRLLPLGAAAMLIALLWAGLYFSYSQSSLAALFAVTVAIALVAGLLASLLIPRRRLWVKAMDGGLELAGLARGEDPRLEGAVDDLARRLRGDDPDAAPPPADDQRK